MKNLKGCFRLLQYIARNNIGFQFIQLVVHYCMQDAFNKSNLFTRIFDHKGKEFIDEFI